MSMYLLECYDDATEECIGEISVLAATGEILREIFGAESEDCFANMWQVDAAIAQRLAPYLEKPLRLDGCTWFLIRRAIPDETVP